MSSENTNADLIAAFLREKGLDKVPRVTAAVLEKGTIEGKLNGHSTRGETKSDHDLTFEDVTGYQGRHIVRATLEQAKGLKDKARYRLTVEPIEGYVPVGGSWSSEAFAATHRMVGMPVMTAEPEAPKKGRKPAGSSLAAKLGIDLE